MVKNAAIPTVLIGLSLLFPPRQAVAQAIHLPPAYRTAIPSGEVVLMIRPKTATDSSKTSLVVTDDQLVLILDGGGQEVYPLSNQNIRQLANEIQARHQEDLIVIARYPLYSAQYIESIKTPRAIGTQLNLQAHSGRPEVKIGFGIVFTMAEAITETDDGLLDQTGFQLDLVGMQQVAPVGRYLKGICSHLYTQARLGLNADQRLNVISASEVPEIGAQVESAVQQADQVALTGQLECVSPIKGTTVEFAIVPEYGVSWTRLEPFRFPLLPIGADKSLQPSQEYFNDDVRDAALQNLARTQPLSNGGISARFRFVRDDDIAFYVGAGWLWKEIIQRGVETQLDTVTKEIDPNFLGVILETPGFHLWRAEFGARLGGVVDVRVDAVGRIGTRDLEGVPALDDRVEVDPLLRLVIVKDFPVIN